jgi:hypothetical protein
MCGRERHAIFSSSSDCCCLLKEIKYFEKVSSYYFIGIIG